MVDRSSARLFNQQMYLGCWPKRYRMYETISEAGVLASSRRACSFIPAAQKPSKRVRTENRNELYVAMARFILANRL